MGYSLQDFCRDAAAVLKTGSSRQLHSTATPVGTRYLRVTGTDLENIERLRIDAATGKIQRNFGRQTGAPAAIAR